MLRHECRNLVSDTNKAGGEGGSTFGPTNNIERKVPIRRLLPHGSVEFEDGSIFPFFNLIVLLHTHTHTCGGTHMHVEYNSRSEVRAQDRQTSLFRNTANFWGWYCGKVPLFKKTKIVWMHCLNRCTAP